MIPISIAVSDHKPDCGYYTKDGCLASCGCTWCDGINICLKDADRCTGLNTTAAAKCGHDYTMLYIVSSITILFLLVVILCVAISTVLGFKKRRYVVMGTDVEKSVDIEMKTLPVEKK